MLLIYKIMFEKFPDNARVWVYQADRAFTDEEKSYLNGQLTYFVEDWSAHGAKLLADAKLIGDYFIVFAVDESQAQASGCSIDSSVRFIKSIGEQLKIDFFNRLKVIVQNENESKLIHFSDIKDYAGWNTFNNTITTIASFRKEWEVQVEESPLFAL
jgi:hypothetical protein